MVDMTIEIAWQLIKHGLQENRLPACAPAPFMDIRMHAH